MGGQSMNQIKSEQLSIVGNYQSFDHSIAAQNYHLHPPAQQVLAQQSGQLIEQMPSNSQQLAILDHQANYQIQSYQIGNTEIIDPYHHAYVQQYVQQTDANHGGPLPSLSHSHLVNPHVYHNSLINNSNLHHQSQVQIQSDQPVRDGQTVIISNEYSPMTVVTTSL